MSKAMASNIVGIGPAWLDRRQLGFRNPLGTRNHIYKQLYSSILPYGSWDHTLNNSYISVHGGVFCLEFSPEGSLLVAACEKRSVLMFDPLTHKRIHSVENAHLDSVNCVKFLDSRSFATCSDDFTVALWDARNLTQKVKSLKGHSNWVKNIEYSPQDDLLVTSGFDGSILTWEMSTNNGESSTVYNKVFSTNGLMRTRLSPDATKMVICTTGGYLIVIHNLNLNTLGQDLDGFKPNMYRLMQLSQTVLPIASDFTDLFRGQGRRNRIEFITDFPEGDDAEVVSSLQIHPDGHCAISRNVSNNEKSEWSCIHNIEEQLGSDDSDLEDEDVDIDTDSQVNIRDINDDLEDDHDDPEHDDDDDPDDDDDNDKAGFKIKRWPLASTSISTTPSYIIQHSVVENVGSSSTRGGVESSTTQHDLSVSPSDVWEALVAIQEARNRRESDSAASEVSVGQMFRRSTPDNNAQLESSNFNRPVFIARILPHLGLRRETEEELSQPRDIASQFSRNTSRNSAELPSRRIIGRNSDLTPARCRKSGIVRRKLILAKKRYTSLYRRSLVGLYDRTSILRKPIYSQGKVWLKLKNLKKCFYLNTSYEMNETKRLKNEIEIPQSMRSSCAVPNFCMKLPNLSVNSKSQSSFAKDNSEITKKNVTNIPRPETSNSQNGNPYTSGQTNLGSGRENKKEINKDRMRLSKINEIENYQRRNETEVGNNVVEEPSSSVSSRSASSSEKTILVGVFRTENHNGVRGTSMRKHNVASVTVSSSAQTKEISRKANERLEVQSKKNDRIGSRLKYENKNHSASSSNGNCVRKSDRNENNCIIAHSGQDSNKRKFNSRYSHRNNSKVPINKKIYQNIKRLTHYVEEPNLGQGFIKELSVSPDSRVICSPFGNGIRLLSFSPNVQDIFHCYPTSPPIPLHELAHNTAHSDIVVSTKFSPFHNILVSGCLSGKIVYYQPIL